MVNVDHTALFLVDVEVSGRCRPVEKVRMVDGQRQPLLSRSTAGSPFHYAQNNISSGQCDHITSEKKKKTEKKKL